MRLAPLLFCLGVLGCQKKAEPTQPALDAGVAAATAIDAGAVRPSVVVDAGPQYEFTGTVRGVVKLARGFKLPIAPPVLTHGVKPPSVEPCPPVDKNDQKLVSLSPQTGGLSPIHVALTGMKAVPDTAPATHDLFIDACRLRPTLLGARRGDKVRVTNRSESALVPQLPGTAFMQGLMRGGSQEFQPKQIQTQVSCQFGSYCGETLVITTSHPLYAVTSNEGFFAIEHVPLDQDIKVHAWHPLFKESSVSVRLTHENADQMVELLLEPAPAKPVPVVPAASDDIGEPTPGEPALLRKHLEKSKH